MRERDNFCEYLGAEKSWKHQAILLNKEEANTEFCNRLMKQGYEGFVIQNTQQPGDVKYLYCFFSEDSLHIADVIPVDSLQ
ncbi:hypothetical protein [Neobacillus niacini]|uniref:hypothetical protein n=1 Tax=Neobacillus niacini TaxID=86668 RepID=UPI00285573AD|nr:hypothetical protein [Neobacillus niacini]MDR7002092.1 hypothetical protein [Neobacillus niacini]